MYTIADLLDLSHTLAAPLFAGKTYPYEVLDLSLIHISEHTRQAGITNAVFS